MDNSPENEGDSAEDEQFTIILDTNRMQEENKRLTSELDATKDQIKELNFSKSILKWSFEEKLKKISDENERLSKLVESKECQVKDLHEKILNLKAEIEKFTHVKEEKVTDTTIAKEITVIGVDEDAKSIKDESEKKDSSKRVSHQLSLADKVLIIKELEKSIEEQPITPTKRKRFKCGICPSVFYDDDIFNRHLKLHERAQKLSPQKSLRSITKTKSQISSPTRSFVCQKCNALCSTERGLNLHDIRMHLNKKSGKFKCSCGFSAHKQKLLEKHVIICPRKVKAKSSPRFKNTTPMVSIDRKYECPECPFATDFKRVYITHVNYHDECSRGIFECTKCNYSSDLRIQLNNHQKVHLKTYEKLVKCPHCEFASESRYGINRHMKVHKT